MARNVRIRGPWRIVDECPAEFHNTLRAAQGRQHQVGARARCVCPHSLQLNAAYNAGQRGRREGTEGNQTRSIIIKVNEAPIPDFATAACGTVYGRRIHERAINNPQTRTALEPAQRICRACPIMQQCQTWILKAEIIPGSWYGVFGGLTSNERKRLRSAHAA